HRGAGMAAAVARSDLLDPEAPDLRRSVRLRHAPRGDEGPRDGAGRRRQGVCTTPREGPAPARQVARVHLVDVAAIMPPSSRIVDPPLQRDEVPPPTNHFFFPFVLGLVIEAG